MKNQYLLVAENIVYKNNKLTAINIYDQFLAMQLPAEFSFDLAILCGPGWEPGDYDLDILVRTQSEKEVKLGNIKMNIPAENFVYNAMANNLNLNVNDGVDKVTFIVKNGDDLVLEREFNVNTLAQKAAQ